MTVDGIDYIYLETRNWGRTVRFWQDLGFTLTLDLGTSGRLDPPSGGGPGLFIEEVSPETPLATGVYLRAGEGPLPTGVEVAVEPIESHWGTTLTTIRDPDGREFVLQRPAGD